MAHELDMAVLKALRAFHARSGHVFPDHRARHAGRSVRLGVMGLVWRVAHGRVAPEVLRELERLGCPLTPAAYMFGRKLHGLICALSAHGIGGLQGGSSLGAFMQTLQTPEGVPSSLVTAEVQAKLESLPGWTWHRRPKGQPMRYYAADAARRSRLGPATRGSPAPRRPPARPKRR